MPATLLDGARLAETIRAEAAAAGAELARTHGVRPGLATVRVGDDPASEKYVNQKVKQCAAVGFANFEHHLPTSTTQDELLALIGRLNADAAVHGILVQLPLPPQVREEAVIRAIDPRKDVDAFHPENVGLLTAGHPRFLPCTPQGVVQLLGRNGVATDGARVVVVGRSNIVGKPLAIMLMQKPGPVNGGTGNATVTVAHTRTRDLPDLTRTADVLVAAVGRARAVTADMVRPGAVVVDVGVNRGEGRRVVGDVDFEAVRDVAGAITPVPGGVGPMTVAMLLHNTAQAARLQLTGA
jgi:methylenetetrahydrofolate dehydrogenase (NADP+) / methenyltetrahydrofolate cyclohydrolase